MKPHMTAVAIGGLVIAAAAAPPVAAAPKPAAACSETCLSGLADQYVSALLAHRPDRLPLAKGARFTENTNTLKLGDGLWRTIDGVEPFDLTVADPGAGEVASFRVIEENGNRALFAVRLRARGGRISEIETFVVRKISGIHGNFDTVPALDPAWGDVLPPAERPSRATLISAANAYFDGIEQGDGDIVPFVDATDRVENLMKTAPMVRNGVTITARDSFNSKIFNYIHKVTGRRFLIIDERRGLVVANYMFQHPGDIRQVTNADGKTIRITGALASYPNTTSGMEAFKVRNGKIEHIFSYVLLNAYGQPSGWDKPAAGTN